MNEWINYILGNNCVAKYIYTMYFIGHKNYTIKSKEKKKEKQTVETAVSKNHWWSEEDPEADVSVLPSCPVSCLHRRLFPSCMCLCPLSGIHEEGWLIIFQQWGNVSRQWVTGAGFWQEQLKRAKYDLRVGTVSTWRSVRSWGEGWSSRTSCWWDEII